MTGPRRRLLLAAGAVGLLLTGVGIGVSVGTSADAGGPGGAPRGGAKDGGAPRGGNLAPAITVAAVVKSSVEKQIDAVGVSRAARSVTLISEATGLVSTVAIRSGARVAAGDVLMTIDDKEQTIALARLKAQYPIARANAERYADLLKNGAASRLEAEAAFNADKAMEAELRAAEYAVSQRTIRAPFAGIVGLTTVETGDYIRAGDVATTIDDLSSLIVEFAVPQESAADIAVGQKVVAALAAADRAAAEGAITAIDSRVDAVSRTLKVEATFENAGGALLSGATYAVTTTNGGAAALAAPGLAVQWDRTGAYVWKLGQDGSVTRVPVRILQRRGETAFLEGALETGARIVVEGADRVRPDMTFPAAAKGADPRGSG